MSHSVPAAAAKAGGISRIPHAARRSCAAPDSRDFHRRSGARRERGGARRARSSRPEGCARAGCRRCRSSRAPATGASCRVSDRGPNGQPTAAAGGRTFPSPGFAPTIYELQADDDGRLSIHLAHADPRSRHRPAARRAARDVPRRRDDDHRLSQPRGARARRQHVPADERQHDRPDLRPDRPVRPRHRGPAARPARRQLLAQRGVPPVDRPPRPQRRDAPAHRADRQRRAGHRRDRGHRPAVVASTAPPRSPQLQELLPREWQARRAR